MFNKLISTQDENEVLDRLNIPEIWMSRDEQEFLNSLILRLKPKKIVEIGVYAGGSSAIILNSASSYKNFHLHSIDYNKMQDYSSVFSNRGVEETGIVLKENYMDIKDKWTLYTGGLTMDFIEKIGGAIDLCFIDTRHSPPAEILDFLMVLPFLKKGATVIFHDTSLNLCRAYHSTVTFNYNGFINCSLMSAIDGKKTSSNINTRLSNIGAIKMSKELDSTIENVLNLLVVSWSYMLKNNEIEDLYLFFKKYYNLDLATKFQKIVKLQKIIRKDIEYNCKSDLATFFLDDCKNKKIKKIVIYGTGEIAKNILDKKTNDLEILYFITSNPKKDEEFMGYEVKHPKTLQNLDKNTFVAISSIDNSYQMIKSIKTFKNIKIIDISKYDIL